jgi:TrmH family RNA methyltransferase
MLSKNKIKFINTLKKKKHRNEKGLFIAEGTKVVTDLLDQGMEAELLCATEAWLATYPVFHSANITEHIEITEKELQKISTLSTPQEVLAIFRIPPDRISEEDLSRQLSLVLDKINDPGNLGTIIRIADWFGIPNIICSSNTVDVYNPKTVQATMGSVGRVSVAYRELDSLLKEAAGWPGFNIYGSFLEGENLYQAHLGETGMIVMGSESHGIDQKLLPYINRRLYIPSFPVSGTTGAESLNVSVATGIVCSEFRRRYHSK